MAPDCDLDLIRGLAGRLFDPTVRRSPDAVAALLADDFREFGRSGGVHDREDVIRSLAAERPDRPGLTASGYALTILAHGVCLLTYRTVRRGNGAPDRHTLRSSIWTLTGGRWRMTFHQGTPTGPEP